jgi:glycosyltransferase involved in cell wall biosynthesis
MNWIHRRRRTGLRHYFRAEYGNIILNTIRRRLADKIVYQSEFARQWWDTEKGQLSTPAQVIHNGVDINTFTPHGSPAPPEGHWRILVVEGNLAGGYDLGLEHAIELTGKMTRAADQPVELVVAGNVPKAVQAQLEAAVKFPLQWMGHLPQTEIPALDRSAHLLFSADVNAACPNSVIEAMACGLPILALKSGALPELVGDEAGIVVPYGGDPWQLDPPDLEGLANAGLELIKDQARFRVGVRKHAEKHFSLDKMVERYLDVL